KGDATNADGTQSWYGDLTYGVRAEGSWFIRSGYYSLTTIAGVFFAHYGYGHAASDCSSRVVAKS
ncbi:MAG: hypothetical protein RR047_00985, partial [Bacilli bacterium]